MAPKELLEQLPYLSDSQIKEEYLNDLKSREIIAQIVPNIQQKAEALRVVKLALEVDLKLGANLAGLVNPEFQRLAIALVARLKIAKREKIKLLGVTGSDLAIPALVHMLKHEEKGMWSAAARALGKIASKQAILALLRCLNDQQADVQSWAAWALGQTNSKIAVVGLQKLLNHSAADVRKWAIWGLGEMTSGSAFNVLQQALKHHDPEVRWRSICALGKRSSAVAIPGLLQTLKDENHFVRGRAAWALGKIGNPVAVRGLAQLLEDRDSHVVALRATEALGEIGSEVAVTALLQAVGHADADVRAGAVSALGKTGCASAVAGLLRAMEDEDSLVRGRAVEGLGKIGGDAAIKGLLRGLKDWEYYVRWRTVEVLGEIATDEATAALLEALNDPEMIVRQRAIKSLQEIRSPAAISGLNQALNHAFSDVQEGVAQALLLVEIAENWGEFSEDFNGGKFNLFGEVLRAASSGVEGKNSGAVAGGEMNSKAGLQAKKLPELLIVSQAEAAEKLLDPLWVRKIEYLISIGSPGVEPPKGFNRVEKRLRLQFHDIDKPVNDPEYVLPMVQDIHKVIDFADGISDAGGYLLVHCHAGVSRSAAVALTVCAALLGGGKEEEAVAMVLAARPQARPNGWIVELADEVLERDGKLLSALVEAGITWTH